MGNGQKYGWGLCKMCVVKCVEVCFGIARNMISKCTNIGVTSVQKYLFECVEVCLLNV